MAWWHAAKLTVEACFLLFHASIMFCVAKEKRNKTDQFSSPFFTFYLLQSVFDVIFVLSYGICTGLSNFGIFIPFVDFALASGVYGQLGQAIAHALISGNRFTAIVLPQWNEHVWSTRRTLLASLFAFLAPIPVFIVKMNMHYRFVFAEETNGYIPIGTNQLYVTLNAFLTFGYVSTIAMLSFILEVATFVVYRRLSRAAQMTRRDDYKLLVYAMTQMVGQLLAALCASQVVIKTIFGYQYFTPVTPTLFQITVDLLGLTGPVCLLVTSGVVRSHYLHFLFGRCSQTRVGYEVRVASSMNNSSSLRLS